MKILRVLSAISQMGNALTLLILGVGLIWLVGAAIGVTAFMGINGINGK